MSSPPILFFDVEAGGLSGYRSSILSISHGEVSGPVKTLYAKPSPGSFMSRWSENKVWEPIQQELRMKGISAQSEKEILGSFLTQLEEHTKQEGAIIAGWNIGYEVAPQRFGESRMRGFDIPMLMTRAKKYGLEERFRRAFKRATIRDMGQEMAVKLSRIVSKERYRDLVDPDLWKQAVGYRKAAGASFPTVAEEARYLATSGAKFAGWKQDLSFELLTGRSMEQASLQAHLSKADVGALREMYGIMEPGRTLTPTQEKELVVKWNRLALRNKLVSSAKYGTVPLEELTTRATTAGIGKEFAGGIQELVSSHGLSKYTGRIEEEFFRIRGRVPQAATATGKALIQEAGQVLGKRSLIAAGTIGLIALGMTKPLSWFSGKDGEYNTIEGLPHGGEAERLRREMTDFGSGYKGLPESLMGVSIDPRLLKFRTDVWDVPEERVEFKAELKEKQKATQARLGTFVSGDLEVGGLEALEGMKQRDQRMKSVNLDRFDIEVEDADTVLLKRKGFIDGIKSFFGYGDISVRLAGIDAPETASHAGDPLGDVRIWQEQPAGKAASSILQSMLKQQGEDLELLVSTGEKTYGRYLGILAGKDKNINLELIRSGAVSALPFGPRRKDILAREEARVAEETAWTHRKGLWGYARYQAARIANVAIGRPITHNVLTREDKLASNLSLGAYGSWLESFGAAQRELDTQEVAQARRMGNALRRSHGPRYAPRFSGKDDQYNTIEGLGHTGIAQDLRHEMTDFASGWIRMALSRGIATESISKAARTLKGQHLERATGITEEVASFLKVSPSDLGQLERVTTTQGQTFLLGKQLGEGGIGIATRAFSPEGVGPAVFKTLKSQPSRAGLGWRTKIEAGGQLFAPGGPAGRPVREIFNRMQGGPHRLTPETEKLGKFIFAESESVLQRKAGFARRKGLVSELSTEAAMQKAAWKTDKESVARVYGESKKGFFQEFVGHEARTPEELNIVESFVRKQAARHETSKIGQIMHYDLHFGNVMVTERGTAKLIDFGMAAPATRESIAKGKGWRAVFEEGATIQKQEELFDISSVMSSLSPSAQLLQNLAKGTGAPVQMSQVRKLGKSTVAGRARKKIAQASLQRSAMEQSSRAARDGSRRSKQVNVAQASNYHVSPKKGTTTNIGRRR